MIPDGGTSPPQDLTQYVNPFIGTRPASKHGAGNTFPGADAPFGMVQWSPDTHRSQPGGYAHTDDKIRGFSLTHLSGAGCDGAQDLPFMPYAGTVTTSPATEPDTYLDGFSHDAESARPGYYGVELASGTKVELTATQRSGAGRFTYPSGSTASLLINVSGSIGGASDAQVTIDEDRRTITGYVASGHFCRSDNRYRVYFSATFDQPFATVGTWHNDIVTPGGKGDRKRHEKVSVSGTGSGAYVTFDNARSRPVGVKVGLSYVSIAGAAENAKKEQGPASFDAIAEETRMKWNSRLRQIEVSGGTDAQRTTFYTALYHSLLQPNVFDDVNGEYIGFDGRIHKVAHGHHQYANFSGWDIYRSQVQLLALLAPDVASDIARSMYNQAHQAGDVWDRWSVNNDFAGVMNGDPYHSILASMYAFGATDFPAKAALASMVKGATTLQKSSARYVERPGLADYQSLGYVPGDVSTTLEYTTADFGIAQLAGRLGDTRTRARFMKRAQNWQNLFNPANSWLQPRNRDRSFVTPFDPADASRYVEGNGAQYHWMVPYDLAGLFTAMGGSDRTVARLDEFFTELNAGPHKPHAFLGNQPSLNSPWTYVYAGAPYRTQDVVRRAVNTLYGPGPDGEAGNDDLGTMSSWYVWSALGMYPQVPGRAELVLASPLFPAVTVHRDGGRSITIKAPGADTDTRYVHALKVNGTPSSRAWLPESFVRDGGTLDYTLGDTPDRTWGAAPEDAPPSFRAGETSYFTSTGPGHVKLRPGGDAQRAKVTVRSLKDTGTTVHWKAVPPDGVTVTPVEGDITVPPRGTGTASVRLAAAAGTTEGFTSVPLTLTGQDGTALPRTVLDVVAGNPGSVLWNLNNNGISPDVANPTGDFDGGGVSYSAKALADAGVRPGGKVTAGDFTFTWPDVGPGDLDNIVAGSPRQTLNVNQGSGTRLSLLGAASNGSATGTLTLTFSDGTVQKERIGFSDWTLGGGRQQPEHDNTVAVTTAYRIGADGRDEVDTHVFATAPITLPSGKRLVSVTLPEKAEGGAMHIFAVATG
ncbi:GH92 family glycosyl hydrolase [Streptomyces spinoverrucosus]|uniref:GH92 family glycosyl hydrolase n=1 Tax=Streptomyces spinoverrucosus TaxID=284043 RepID=UPI0027DA348A|nr:GH92 family glycosyl hydrolase [Streptomyces spinoverrucosus]